MPGSLHYSKMLESRKRNSSDIESYTQELNTSKAKNQYNLYGLGLGMKDDNIGIYIIISIQSFFSPFSHIHSTSQI